MTPYLSVIIPTYNRIGALQQHLKMLREQSLRPDLFQVVIINDGGEVPNIKDNFPFESTWLNQKNSGPASARNLGVEYAQGKVILFVGDDTLPHRGLLWRHYQAHLNAKDVIAIQGYTDWWPNLPPLALEKFLYSSGLQANWTAIKNNDGSWKKSADGFCLTTNYSIVKSEFERIGGFNDTLSLAEVNFPYAAWEDVEMGARANYLGVKTFFEPEAINYHAHRQTIDGFVRRQITEGKARIVLSTVRPEVAGGLLDPQGLRDTNVDMLQRAVQQAKSLLYYDAPEFQELRAKQWTDTFRLASLEGIRQGIEQAGGVTRAIPHVHTHDQCMYIMQIHSALSRGDLPYAAIAVEWLIKDSKDNWAVWCVDGEVSLAMGNQQKAIASFQRALELGPGEKWPVEMLDKLK